MKVLNSKKIVIGVLAVCLLLVFRSTVYAQGQTDTLFYFSNMKVKGIYKSFEEFRKNKPSIVFPAGMPIEYLEEETVYEGNLPIAQFNCDSVAPCEKKTPIWGFYDGTNVYISRTATFDKKNVYDKVRYLGRYIYYQTILKANGNETGPGASSGGYTMGGARKITLIEKGIDINTGETFELSNLKITKILSNDKALTAEFKKEKKKEKRQNVYLIKYAEKHKEQIKK